MIERPHPTVRGRGPAIMVMLVLLLAASTLFSTAAPHHHAGARTFAACVDLHQPDEVAHEHEHRHGNDWTPRLSQRARVVAGTVVAYPRRAVVPPVPVSTAPGAATGRSSVLRV
ncbi:hypothetical protein [Actinoplanes xinjiangensis]|uniref:hypothetical protein n=1 Tax=Actinoplanes xinjiangensis TaxID=512350 RepID=UPI003438F410